MAYTVVYGRAMPKVILSIRVDEGLIPRLDAIAEASGETRSEAAERALRNGVQDAEDFLRQLDTPVLREAWAVLSSKRVLRALAALGGESNAEGEMDKVADRVRLMRENSRKRKRGAK